MNLLRSLLLLLTCAGAFGQGMVVNPYRFSAAPPGGTPVDLLFQWTGTQGLLTTNIVVASEIGADKGAITYAYNFVFNHTVITNESFTRAPFLVGGVAYSNFAQSIVFNIDAANTNQVPVFEGFERVPSETHSNLSVNTTINFNLGGSANWDFIRIDGGTYSVVQFVVTTGVGYLAAHGDNGSTTRVGVTDNLLNGHDYSVTIRHNTDVQQVQVIVIDAASGALVGSGYAPSSIGQVTHNFIQDYLWAAGTSGNFRMRYLAFDWSNAALPMEPMPTVLPVTNLVATQISTNEIDVTWGKQAYTEFVVEKNDGTNWSTVTTNVATTYVDTNALVVGATYTYRVTAKAFQYVSTATTSTPLTLVNIQWHDSIEPADADTVNNADNGIPVYAAIHLSSGGTATKLRVWSTESRGSNVKLALYNSSKVLLANGAVTMPNDFLAQWCVASISSTSLASGDYYVGFVCDTTDFQKWKYKSTGGLRLYKFQSYAAFPSNPIGEDGSQALDMPVGILTQ